jgi:hypothetical protein
MSRISSPNLDRLDRGNTDTTIPAANAAAAAPPDQN